MYQKPEHKAKQATPKPGNRSQDLLRIDRRSLVVNSTEIDPNNIDLMLWDFDGTIVETEEHHMASYLKAAEELFEIQFSEKAISVLRETAKGVNEIHSAMTIISYAFRHWRELGIDRNRLLALHALPEISNLIGQDLNINDLMPNLLNRYPNDITDNLSRRDIDKQTNTSFSMRLCRYILDIRHRFFTDALDTNPRKIRPGVETILNLAKMYRIQQGLVTGSSFRIVDSVLTRFDLQESINPKLRFFPRDPRPLSAHELKDGHEPEAYSMQHAKPNPDCYVLALHKAEVDSSRALVFENSASGVLAAVRAGIRVIASPDQDFFRDSDPLKNMRGLERKCIEAFDKHEIVGKELVTIIPDFSCIRFNGSASYKSVSTGS